MNATEGITYILEGLATTCKSLQQEGEKTIKVPRKPDKKDFQILASIATDEANNVLEPFGVGVVGVFKVGKSYFLNTFLDRTLLKVARDEATSVTTELVYVNAPEEESGRIKFRDGSEITLPIEEALKYTDINSDVFPQTSREERGKKQALLQRITLYLHNDVLKLGRFVDTPGLGGSQVGDQQAYDSITKMDAALIVFTAERPGNINELEAANTVNKYGREVIAVLNKVDDNKGNFRSATELGLIEDFIRKTFTTLAKDENGQSLIFRYSAKEIRKAQKILKDKNTTTTERAAAEKALNDWGYTDLQSFILSRYFSNSREKRAGKKQTVQSRLLHEIDRLLALINGTAQTAQADYNTSNSSCESKIQDIEKEIFRKSTQVEIEAGAFINTQLKSLTQEIEDNFINVVESRTSIDVGLLKSAFVSKEELANDIRSDFNILYPNRKFEEWSDKVTEGIQTIVYKHWAELPEEDTKANVILPSFNSTEFTSLIKSLTTVLAGLLATHLVLLIAGFIFAPAAGFALFLSVIIAIAYGGITSSVKTKKLRELRAMVADQMQSKLLIVKAKFSETIQETNAKLAEISRLQHADEIGVLTEQAENYREEIKFWNSCTSKINYWRNELVNLE